MAEQVHTETRSIDGAASALDDGFGSVIDILDCLQDRPNTDGRAIPEKSVRLAQLRRKEWNISTN